MVDVLEDRFVVFVRDETATSQHPETAERVVASCYTREEAVQVQERLEAAGRRCIIRYEGPAGGGD
jgi:hypothetical protein